jgi:hypothetical protein
MLAGDLEAWEPSEETDPPCEGKDQGPRSGTESPGATESSQGGSSNEMKDQREYRTKEPGQRAELTKVIRIVRRIILNSSLPARRHGAMDPGVGIGESRPRS